MFKVPYCSDVQIILCLSSSCSFELFIAPVGRSLLAVQLAPAS
jgi:hypothetical protein